MKLKELMSKIDSRSEGEFEVHSGNLHNMEFNRIWEHADCEVIKFKYCAEGIIIIIEDLEHEL